MTDLLVIDGCPPWDGRYPVDSWEFTNQELYDIKTVSHGIRGGELFDALDSADSAAFVAVAVVILARAGKRVDPDDLWAAKAGSVRIELGVTEDAPADPLPVPVSGSGESASDASSTPDSDSGSES